MMTTSIFCLLAAAASAVRLDAALVSRGLCASRGAAKTAISKGLVTVDGTTITKAAHAIGESAAIILAEGGAADGRYVSRAGDKLRAALDAFNVDVSGGNILDVGASTGGFSHCALDAGAASATCVDCGHDQLHPTLQQDARVTSLEGVNARTLTPEQLPRASFDCVVVDVSFISLRLILPAIWPLLDTASPSARLVALVKPQFEAGKEAARKGRGLIKDAATHERVLSELSEFAHTDLDDCTIVGSMASPILGGEGQKEFLIALAHASHGDALGPRGPYLSDAEDDSSAAPQQQSSGDSIMTSAAGTSATAQEAAVAMEMPNGAASLPLHEVEGGLSSEDCSGPSGLTAVTRSRPSTAASRSAKYARKKELDSLKSGRDRAGKTDGGGASRGRRGRKNKTHRQSVADGDDDA